MLEIGYKFSSEEFGPLQLVRQAQRAEEGGFSFGLISDHFHPWTDRQGQSPFVWSVLGSIASATSRLRVGTGVTCPIQRIHPAIIAQAAATVAAMMEKRFFLGLGSGENLNEHILGDRWPPANERQARLREAVEIIRTLWQGQNTDYSGDYYKVENARIYTLPETLPPILLAAAGPRSAELAGQIGDGLIGTSPDDDLVNRFRDSGGVAKPCYAELSVCWADREAEAKRLAYEQWPIAGIKGELMQELRVPAHFEQAAKMVDQNEIGKSVVCGPDPEKHLAGILKYAKAGFESVAIHQIGPDQEGFFRFYEKEILPNVRRINP